MESSIPVFHFKDQHIPQIAQVGGKGYSLIKMTQAGLAVPPGFVLAVSFFKAWILQLKALDAWQKFLLNSTQENINELKANCANLVLTEEQNQVLNESLSKYPDLYMFAVRSSSPEEDLAGASFAGGYETILGVKHETMVDAIKKAFASCLDYRVYVYKKEKGFATDEFSIAIVIMAQIASEISGVGFSLNPLNNDYDEAVFNANWGLGETVVGGLCNPDQYIVNKINKEIIECKIGKKETQIWLKPNGGTYEKEDPRHAERSLKDNHIKELVEQILIIEKYYNQPMDIEWAIEKDILYILQARPITTQLELPDIMKTKPGEPRNLYLDLTLVVQGFEKPMSVLGADTVHNLFFSLTSMVFASKDVCDIHKGLIQMISGKIFMNVSNLWSKFDQKKISNNFKSMNLVAGQLLEEADPKIYSGRPVPYSISFSKLGMFWRVPALKFVFPNFFMNRIIKNIENGIKHFDEILEIVEVKRSQGKLYIGDCIDIIMNKLSVLFLQCFAPALIGGMTNGQNKIKVLFEKYNDNTQIQGYINDLIRSLPHNITNEMGLDLYRLIEHIDKEKYHNFQVFLKDFNENKLSEDFSKEWKKFIKNYGFRGQAEIDVRSSRYYDNPEIILEQMHNLMMNSSPEKNPVHIFANAEKQRGIAHSKLYEIAQKDGFLKDFEKTFSLTYNLGGYRESHKYYAVKVFAFLRTLYLNLGDALVKKGLFKNREQIFDLTLQEVKDIDRGKCKPNAQILEEMIKKNLKINGIFLKCQRNPITIDSRGRIATLKKKPLKKDELEGQSVSFGKFIGFVKVLKSITEKPFYAGEILVTKATDPGWTPLIINAGAILLEVGGMLQHGALVSREFGKPCIVGIDDVTKILKDGDEVEVDATTGIVRVIKEKKGFREEKKE